MHVGSTEPRVRGDQTWQDSAACARSIEVVRDADLFFPGPTADEQRIGLAKRICSGCQVRSVCLEAALEVGDASGIRGGMTESERKASRHFFDLRRDPERVSAALSGKDVYLTKGEREDLIRRAVESGAPTLRLAQVLKVSEGHVKKLLRRERRVVALVNAGSPATFRSICEAITP
ncbi:WhiB family transcriptional regulator [Streptomyces sp. NBC_00487]|uniref:WhiB family transcriptional regulator n=1 Tax=unclassified Streptomyces TaxID=2593676 RepID=UPI002E18EA27